MVPVLPSSAISRDVSRYFEKTGFEITYQDRTYSILGRDHLSIHLQWHADTNNDPLPGGSVIRIFVNSIRALFENFVSHGRVDRTKYISNTPWCTDEFGFHALNHTAIFIVEDLA